MLFSWCFLCLFGAGSGAVGSSLAWRVEALCFSFKSVECSSDGGGCDAFLVIIFLW